MLHRHYQHFGAATECERLHLKHAPEFCAIKRLICHGLNCYWLAHACRPTQAIAGHVSQSVHIDIKTSSSFDVIRSTDIMGAFVC